MAGFLDALSSIADTLDAYGSNSSRLALMQREARSLDHESTPLASAIRSTLHKKRRYKDIGNVSILDATCRDLEFSGWVDIAQGLTARISGVIDRMGEWEKSWRMTVKRHGLDVDRFIEENPDYELLGAADYLGQLNDQTEYEALQQFDGVTEHVTDVVSWIRQFVIVQRKLNADGGQDKKPEAESTPVQKPEESAESDSATKWSKFRSPSEWEWVFEFLGEQCSWKTIGRKNLRKNPDGTTRRISFDISQLPTGYDDTLSRPKPRVKSP